MNIDKTQEVQTAEEQKEFPTTPAIRLAQTNYTCLRDDIGRALKGSFLRPVPMKEKIEYIRALAEAKQDMWERVYREYPQVKGKTITLNEWTIVIS